MKERVDMNAAALFNVSGLATVVTGGASGLGLAYTSVMAQNGARVTIMDANAKALDEVVERFRSVGQDVRGEVVDVTDRMALDRSFDATARHYGRLDVVFANAGIGGGPGFLKLDGERNPDRALENIPGDLWDRVIAVDLTSVFATLQAAARHMKGHGGRIIVTTSISAIRTETLVAAPYVAAKAGAAQLVRQAALELARYNITVNAIAPGPFVTNISGGRLKDPAVRAPFERFSPIRRVGEPDDIKGLALFLASPAAELITGAQIVIDGGVTLGMAD
ncbi:MAG: SDR family NAD(P)-dependent oxidoreductase [Xanthobacteraceae bacterium]|jgi:NAD(P)-dependent dehydrogenase (short-subunit alcohol dehydrogenase family)